MSPQEIDDFSLLATNNKGLVTKPAGKGVLMESDKRKLATQKYDINMLISYTSFKRNSLLVKEQGSLFLQELNNV